MMAKKQVSINLHSIPPSHSRRDLAPQSRRSRIEVSIAQKSTPMVRDEIGESSCRWAKGKYVTNFPKGVIAFHYVRHWAKRDLKPRLRRYPIIFVITLASVSLLFVESLPEDDLPSPLSVPFPSSAVHLLEEYCRRSVIASFSPS